MVHFTLNGLLVLRRPSCVVLSVLLVAAVVELGEAVLVPGEAQAQPRKRRARNRGRGRDQRRHARSASAAGKDLGGKTGFADLPGEKSFNECRKYPGNKRIKVTLKPDSELHDLVAWISGMTCKRFIVTGKIRAPKVTIVSPTAVTPREAYRAFLSALNSMGLTIQPAGRYLKIIELTDAPRRSVMTCRAGQRCPRDDRVVTQLFRLKHVEPDDVSTVLQQLTKGPIVTYGATNLLIITDTGANITRLRKIIRELDQPAQAEKIWFIKVKHALASEVAETALKVFPDAGDGAKGRGARTGSPRRYQRRGRRRKAATRASTVVKVKGGRGGPAVSKIIAEERSNSLVVVADDRGYLQVVAFVKRVDIPKAGGEGRLHIVKLQNADAVELAATLSGLASGGSRASRSPRRGARSKSRSRSRSSARASSGSRTSSVQLFAGEVTITDVKANNSLLIVASTRDYLALHRVIRELDKPRRQVFVEATILEVSLSKQRDLGLSWHGGHQVGKGDNKTTMIFGNNASNTVQPGSVLLEPGALMGMAAGLFGPEIKGVETLLGKPGISIPSFGVLFQALQSNDDVNLVSAPHILATDNEEAVISVGENVPFQSTVAGVPSLTGGGTTSVAGVQSISREDVALTLKLTPYVNDSGFVRMKIDGELEEVKSFNKLTGPTVVKRSIKTMVTVRDQQTVVIGGLITNKTKKYVQKVPLLGDIPILGYLFKTTVTTVEKANLLIFLTPYVVQDQSDLRRIFQRKIQQRREFIERFTAFKNVDYEAAPDYSHKRGLVAEIDRVARFSEQEARLKKQALEASRDHRQEGLLKVDPRDLKRINQPK